MLCTPLALPGEVLGSLTLASTRRNAFDPEAVELASVFAAHATLAVSNRRIARNLTAMAGSRDVIGQAKGILMERHRMTAAQAFTTLARVSQNHNIKLRVLCEHLAATGELPGAPLP
ncbi:ANTAR domain-containing protein [Nakamurella deserti]|uniref:ANTAR domain-containing protein n=1 Tax=Nakamurella deserti TaxID=2164074 RepID=UPI000DBE3FDC|nr:GAF and ANTAR domain-containing protein [Nakamurella deserti]